MGAANIRLILKTFENKLVVPSFGMDRQLLIANISKIVFIVQIYFSDYKLHISVMGKIQGADTLKNKTHSHFK